jgi:glyoxylase-like metal-dependent hydrolase (beta-lactamase superfamily II)
VVEGEGGPVLVDTGIDTPEGRAALREGVGDAPLAAVVLTHAHVDHYGLAGPVRERSGAPLVLHAAEDALADRWVHRWPEERAGVGEHFRGVGVPPALAEALLDATDRLHARYRYWAPDLRLEGDEGEVPGGGGWRWIHTPGHSPGHVVLHHPGERLLIAGDHVLPRISPNVGADLYADDPLSDYLASLARIRDLPVELVLPSHGAPFPDLAGRVDALARHHDRRNTRLLEALGAPATVLDAAGRLFPDLPPDSFLHAVRETRAHLLHLHRLGAVDRDVQSAVELWTRR